MIKPETRQAILMLRQQGEAFAGIARQMSLSPNTVKSICLRSGIQVMPAKETDSDMCRNCGQPLAQILGKKQKTFCSTQCRTAWWNRKRRRKPYRLTCRCCGEEFISFGNQGKAFCGRECYRLSRYGKGLP